MTAPATAPAGWTGVPPGHPFGLQTLPYGSMTVPGRDGPRAAVAIGDRVLDLTAASAALLPARAALFRCGTLDGLLAAGPDAWAEVRAAIIAWLTEERHRGVVEPLLVPAGEVGMRLPFTVADYVDFYASEQHAVRLGQLLRPGTPPLTPNWKHLPLGYHGRAGTVVVSGTPVGRPGGQYRTPGGELVVGPSARVDFEAELGFVVGAGSRPGRPVALAAFERHVFGACLVNDWSARDIQAWECVPLGPLLGKSFATSVSPWLVPLAALTAARTAPPPREPRPVPYLDDTDTEPWGLDVTLDVRLNGHPISRPPFAAMYWTAAQQLAHLTVNGAAVRTGDLLASGTVSGAEPGQRGSLIELTWDGREPLILPDGTTRTYLEDGDEVTITATAPGPDGTCIGFGAVRGRVVPQA